jgi:hypothetical protein
MTKTVELITVVYAGDLANLYYHALSLKKYWTHFNPKSCKWTIVVEDCLIENRQQPPADPNYSHMWCVKHIAPMMTGWNVQVVNCPPTAASDGWFRQQVGKLWAAANSTMEWSVVLDCKNFLVRRIHIEDFFKDGKLLGHVFGGDRQPSIDHVTACKLFDKDVNSTTESFNITPFIWNNQVVRDMLKVLDSKDYNIFKEPMMVSEAVLYWCYSQDKIEWIPSYENDSIGQYGGCEDHYCLPIDVLDKEIASIVTNKIKIFTMHRFHTTPSAFASMNNLLKARYIINDADIKFYKKTFLENLHTLRPTVLEFLENKWKPKEIIRNGNTIKFDRIVAYGCSFTEGAELADHMFLDPLKPIAEFDKIKRDNPNFYKKYHDWVEIQNDLQYLQKNLSWAKHLSNNFRVDFLNRGFGGNSMMNIVYNIETDLKSGELTDTDFIVVGITVPDRWMFFKDNGDPERVLFTRTNFWPTKEFQEDFVVHIANDYFRLYFWFNSIKYLDMLSERLGGRLIQQYVHHPWHDYKKWTSVELKPSFVQTLEEIDTFKSIIDPNYAMGKFINWHTDTHGSYHPKVEFHRQFADYITNKLTGKNNE